MSDFGIIILAAGNSVRMGQPKQLLSFKGKTLLARITEEALMTTAKCVVVVDTPSEIAKTALITSSRLWTVANVNAGEGIASSIRIGLEELVNIHPQIEACILCVCDQPFVTSDVLHVLVEKYETTHKGIIASLYANTRGTPALFDKRYFPHLQELTGDNGAKVLLTQFPDDLETVSFPMGKTDIDTPDDYQQLLIWMPETDLD